MIVPDVDADATSFAPYPLESPAPLSGRRYFERRFHRRDEPFLVAGPDGVALVAEGFRAAARFDECEVALRWPDGTRTLWSPDGFNVYVDPNLWRRGREVVRTIDANVPADRWVLMEPEREARLEAVARASGESKLKRNWRTRSELDALPDFLESGEELALVARADQGWKSGVLAVTTQRLLFLYFDDLVEEIPLGEIRDVATKPGGVFFSTKLTVRTDDGEHSFGELPREHLDEVAALLRAQ